jgi:hypothetical protein
MARQSDANRDIETKCFRPVLEDHTATYGITDVSTLKTFRRLAIKGAIDRLKEDEETCVGSRHELQE